jgi:L-threonylcarbamoyladenylate synthase
MYISIDKAVELLKAGEVVAVPTETVYGLAASLEHPQAIKQVFKLKGRPSSNPLIIHVSNTEEINKYVTSLPDGFAALAKSFWPGPLTLVLPANIDTVPEIVRAGLHTAAFRVPQHPLASKLLSLTGPLVMPSANLSGTPSATLIDHIEDDFGTNFPVLEGASCAIGVESTILVHVQGQWQIIRQGALAAHDFETVLGYQPHISGPESYSAPLCPGQFFKHYSPKAKLMLRKEFSMAHGEIILGFSDKKYPEGNRIIYLGVSSNPSEIAEKLYKTLRSLDDNQISSALVDIDLPKTGLYLTILERLYKAAAGLD